MLNFQIWGESFCLHFCPIDLGGTGWMLLWLFFLFFQLFVILDRGSDLIDEQVCDVYNVDVDGRSAFHFMVCVTVSDMRNDEIAVCFGGFDFFFIAWLNITKILLNRVLQYFAILNGVFVNPSWTSHIWIGIDENSQIHDVVYLWLRTENVWTLNADDFNRSDFDFFFLSADFIFNLDGDLVA